jgi:phage FluMu protein Com
MNLINSSNLAEKRCDNLILINGSPSVCNGLLFKGEITSGTVEIKCGKCKKIHLIVQAEEKKVRPRIPYKGKAVA